MRLHDICEHFSDIFAACSTNNKATLLNIANPKTSEMLVRPSSFCETVLWLFATSEDFRGCFAYTPEEEREIADSFIDNEQLFASKMLSLIVGMRINGVGEPIVHDEEFYIGYLKTKSDYGFDIFVWEENADKTGQAIQIIDETMSKASVDYIAKKEAVYYFMGWVFYKNRLEDCFMIDDDDEADMVFDTIEEAQEWITEKRLFDGD